MSIEQRFWKFHSDNPHVYDELVRRARVWRTRLGHRKLAIATLFEVCRWFAAMETKGDDFKLNNDFRSYYARLIMEREADLEGIFETRSLRAPEPFDGRLFSEAA